jgi:CDP-glycerol glycerophosphotransferase (TagB/SpsB family)
MGLNVRYFSEYRINQQGKFPVGPRDVFYSHGIGDKAYWRADRIEGYRYAMVPGPAWEDRILSGGYQGKVFVTGYTKLDPVFWGEYSKQERDKPYVVWAPTHAYNGKNKGRSSYPWCKSLINEIPDNYETCLALHPTSRANMKKKNDVTLQELVDADVVIADGGSTLYEAWILGKPVIFPDWLCKNDILRYFKGDPGCFEYRIYDEGIGYHAKDMKHLIKLIDTALSNGMQQQEQEFIESICPEETRGRAGEECAKVLKELI